MRGVRLSPAQWRALRRASRTSAPFRGHQKKTLESLARQGLLTFQARMECVTCGELDCRFHVRDRWRIWATVTPLGHSVLDHQEKSE